MVSKIVSLICDSFNRYDILDHDWPKFTYFDFNNYPANCSDLALYMLQTDKEVKPWYEISEDTPFPYKIPPPGEMVADFVKTRLFSYPFWASQELQYRVDPLSAAIHAANWHTPKNCLSHLNVEPYCDAYVNFQEFLKNEFYQSDVRHVIYWSNIGHIEMPFEKRGYRVTGEDKGIPANLTKTFALWRYMMEWRLLRYIDLSNTIVMIHNDHGSARQEMDFERAMFDGFLFLHHPNGPEQKSCYTWRDLRDLIYKVPKMTCL